jgi:hypothetical protein
MTNCQKQNFCSQTWSFLSEETAHMVQQNVDVISTATQHSLHHANIMLHVVPKERSGLV